MSPTQTGKASIVAVGREPFGAGFNGQSGQIGISNEITLGVRFLAQTPKDIPMPFARHHGHRIGMSSQRLGKLKGEMERRGITKYAGMSHDPQKPAEHDLGNTECRIGSKELIEPVQVIGVPSRVLSVGIDQNINVRQNHRRTP